MCRCNTCPRIKLKCIATKVYCRNNLIGKIECGNFVAFKKSHCPCRG